MSATVFARLGALLYAAWGVFHVYVAWDIYRLANTQSGIAQGRTLQLAAYMLSIAAFAIAMAPRLWRNDAKAYWLNLAVVGWADGIWVAVVVVPGYVPALRGLLPPAIFVAAAVCATVARRAAARG